jgi:ABC-type nitrate/sulfonate/bicarbonate transport system substrate-binding protein
VYIPEPPAQVAALASGAADAIMVSDPALSAALLAGGHAIYGPGSPVPSDYPSATAIAVKRSYLASNRDVVKRFLMANMESIHILKTNPDEAAKYTQSYLKVDDTKVLRQAMTDVANISPDDLIVSDRTLQIVLDATAETDPKVANVKPGDITDFSVIDEIKASHFLDTLK